MDARTQAKQARTTVRILRTKLENAERALAKATFERDQAKRILDAAVMVCARAEQRVIAEESDG